MRIGVNLQPSGDWSGMLATAQAAETSGFDAIGFLDHYHTEKLEWPYISGWSAYGALAMVTSRIHLVPMVIDRLNHLPGVLADEIIQFAHQEIASSSRPITLSVYVWDWPENIVDKLVTWEKLGVERTFLTFWQPKEQLALASTFIT
ncbi:MAG: LLM class flavin-dependent oxidoreductase [Ktedonobacteraceae bacterium]